MTAARTGRIACFIRRAAEPKAEAQEKDALQAVEEDAESEARSAEETAPRDEDAARQQRLEKKKLLEEEQLAALQLLHNLWPAQVPVRWGGKYR